MVTERRVLSPDELRRILSTVDLATPEGVAVGLLVCGCRAKAVARVSRKDVWEAPWGVLVRVERGVRVPLPRFIADDPLLSFGAGNSIQSAE